MLVIIVLPCFCTSMRGETVREQQHNIYKETKKCHHFCVSDLFQSEAGQQRNHLCAHGFEYSFLYKSIEKIHLLKMCEFAFLYTQLDIAIMKKINVPTQTNTLLLFL